MLLNKLSCALSLICTVALYPAWAEQNLEVAKQDIANTATNTAKSIKETASKDSTSKIAKPDVAASKTVQTDTTMDSCNNLAQQCFYAPKNISIDKLSLLEEDFTNVGVALLSDHGEMLLSINALQDFPIMSVYKLPIAYAFAKYATEHHISLEQQLTITPKVLQQQEKNYSPLRTEMLQNADYKAGRNQQVTFKTLIEYAVAQSDSMASDLLVDYIGGFEFINQFLGTDFKYLELTLGERPELSYGNTLTPKKAVDILLSLEHDKDIAPAYKKVIFDAMLFSPTGQSRILAGVRSVIKDAEFQVFDKTGTGAYLNSKRIAVNDMAIIKYQGQSFYLAVFYKDIEQAQDYAPVEKRMQKLTAAIMQSIK